LAHPSLHQLESLVSQGRYLEARELASRLQAEGADSIRRDQLIALSLNKSGIPEAALSHLEPVYQKSPGEPETAGIMGSIYKELFKKHQDTKYALLSRDTYARNFVATKNYYTGINAATMSAIAGRNREARDLATEIIQSIGPDANDYWELATLGEAYLITKQREASIDYYARARRLANKDWGKVMSVYQQLWLLNHYAPVPKDILKIFSPPGVAAFVGHMIDPPHRTEPRFPASIEEQVKAAIKASIRSLNIAIGYCSVACGADILFAEALEEEGGELHIFLPFQKEDFIKTSVAFAGTQWVERCERILALHPPSMVTHEAYNGYDELFELQSKVIGGMSVLGSKPYHQEPRLLTLLSQSDLSRHQGGTRAMLRWWPFIEKHTNIDPDVMRGPNVSSTKGIAAPKPESAASISRPVLHIVYADFKGVSPMDLAKINKTLTGNEATQVIAPRFYRREAEYVYACYDGETEAVGFAQLVWNISSTAGKERGFSMVLHSSPIELSALTQTGEFPSGVIKTISLLAPRGTICASQYFASLLALHPGRYEFGYMGVVQQPGESKGVAVYQLMFSERP
jgi:tetratricopeptide (TPR) repeat protein